MKKKIYLCFLFYLCSVGYTQAQEIPKNANQTDAQGRRQGKWTILYNKDWKVVQDLAQAQFYRIIRYQDDLPIGKVRDYYRSGQVQWEGQLLKDRPKEVMDGKCIWYDESGSKRGVVWYKAGKVIKNREYDNKGELLPIEKAVELYKNKEYEKAIPILERYQKLLFSTPQIPQKALYSLVFMLRDSYHQTGQKKKAKSLELVLRRFDKKFVNDWWYFNHKMQVAFNRKNYQKAIFFAKRAKVLAKKKFGVAHINYVNASKILGLSNKKSGNYVEAEKIHLELVHVISRVLGNTHLMYANVCDNLAYFYLEMFSHKKAERFFKNAREIRMKKLGENHIEYAASLNNLGFLYKTQGYLNKAEPLLKKAKEIVQQQLGTKNPTYAHYCNNLGGLYLDQGFYKRAERLLLVAKNIYSEYLSKYAAKYASVCNNLGLLYNAKEEFDNAISFIEEGKKIRKKVLGINDLSYATSCHNLAAIYTIKGILSKRKNDFFKKAEGLHKEGKAIRKRILGSDHPIYALSCNNLASLYHMKGAYTKAERLYTEAKQLTDRILDEAHPDYILPYQNLAGLYLDQRKMKKSQFWFLKVIQALTANLKNILATTSEKGKRYYLLAQVRYKFSLYDFIATNHVEIRGVSQSKRVLEQMYNNRLLTKSLLFNSTQKTKNRIYASQDTALINQYDAFITKRRFYNKMLELTIKERKKRGVSIESLAEKVDELEKNICRKSTYFNKGLEEYVFHTWKDVKKSLNKGEVAIELIRCNRHDRIWTNNKYYAALIVTPKSRFPYPVFIKNGSFLEGKGFQHYQNLNQSSKIDKKAYAWFWQPIQRQIKALYPEAKRLFVSLDGVYHLLNLETLWNPTTKKYLGDELDIRLVSNTKDLLKRKVIQVPSSIQQNRVHLFGNPNYAYVANTPLQTDQYKNFYGSPKKRDLRTFFKDGSIPRLSGTEKEVKNVQALLQAQNIPYQTHLGVQAKEDKIKNIRSPRVLHLATHGYFIDNDDLKVLKKRKVWAGTEFKQYIENPLLRSGLVWTGAEAAIKTDSVSSRKGENGILTAQEVLNLNLDHTDLVVLSACETGKGEIQNGEGVYGLQRAFLSAGAKQVLMSLWKVDDEATQFFMQYFYESWARDQDVRKAYQVAQQRLRRHYPSPYYWGAFVLVGR